MVRTKASMSSSSGVRAVAAKAPRKSLGSSYSAGSSSNSGISTPGKRSDKYGGGNSYCPRPTPQWQKPISGFFSVQPKDKFHSKSALNSETDADINKENIDPGVSGSSLIKHKPSSSQHLTDHKQSVETCSTSGAAAASSSITAGPSGSSCTPGSSSSGAGSSKAGPSGIKEKRRRLVIESDSDDD